MKIIHIIPGSGGKFYCENCLRDVALVKALRALGHDVVVVPMYLPMFGDQANIEDDSPVFYGAVKVYLKERLPWLRHAPTWLDAMLDSQWLLDFAARRSGSTRAAGLEKMTLSVLQGETGHEADELADLVDWLKEEEGTPDVIHLSNALLLGLAGPLKRALGAPIVCSLQDEDVWINGMRRRYIEAVWQTIGEKVADVDAFTPVSHYYSKYMLERLPILPELMHVVHIGIDLEGYRPSELSMDRPVIGYLSRMSPSMGLKTVVKAFIDLKYDRRMKGRRLRLRAMGGETRDDRAFVDELYDRVATRKLDDYVEFLPECDRESRIGFLESISVLTVPVVEGEAFGTYLLEAMAAGVPVVQPKVGAFPEVLEMTGGGVLYEPNTPDALANTLLELFADPDRMQELGARGREVVQRDFGVETMARKMVAVYEKVVAGATATVAT